MIYQINKGVNKPIVFKGLVAQYIAWLAGGLVFLLLLFAALYLCKVSLWLILPMVGLLGTGLFFAVSRLSKRFGEHGLCKYLAKRGLPDYIRFSSRRTFTQLRRGK